MDSVEIRVPSAGGTCLGCFLSAGGGFVLLVLYFFAFEDELTERYR